MRNLFKKSLTLCLVAILAFSCFAGIVSAETAYTATIAVVDQTITQGTTSVDVTLNINSSQIGINEALIEVSSDIGTINSKATLDEPTAAIASIELPEGSTNYGSFYLSAKNDISGETTVLGSIATASITVTFTVDENKAVGTYPINIKVDGVRAASGNEDVIKFTYEEANISVVAPHVHEYKYTPNEGDKTHNGTCTCGEDAIYNEACVDGDDEDTLCDKCGGETAEAVVPEHTHNWVFDSAVPATETENGSITFVCTNAGCDVENATKTETVTYYANSMLTATPHLGFNATTELIFRLNAKNYDDIATDAIVVYTHKCVNGAADTVKALSIADADTSTTGYYRWKVPVKYNQFSDTLVSVVYSKHENGWVSGKIRNNSVKMAAMAIITGSDETYKSVAANLLKAGAETQKAFNYGSAEDYADVELVGDYAKYITTSTPTVAKTDENWIKVPSDYKETKKVIFATPSILFSDAISIKHKVNPTYFEGGKEALTDLKLVYSYTSYNGAEISGELTDYIWNDNNRAEFEIGLIAPNMRVPIKFQVFNGDTAVSEQATYSIESVMANINESESTYVDLINAVLNYSDSVAAAF